MKCEREQGRLRIHKKAKSRLETDDVICQTLEELISALRAHGINIPETLLEKQTRPRESQNRM